MPNLANDSSTTGCEDDGDELELTELYFSYGTDLAPDILRARGGRPDVVAVARLSGHRVGFFGYTETWDSGLETVVEDATAETWGVLYRMGSSDWERLDSWMGARMDGGGMYFHYPTTVTDTCGRRYRVRMYKKDILGPEMKPSREYMELLLRGAEQHLLPSSYVAQLRRQSSRRAAFAVPASGNAQRGVCAPNDCGSCDAGGEGDQPLVVLRKAAR